MTVDPAVQKILDAMASYRGPAIEEMTPVDLRRVMDDVAAFSQGPQVATEDCSVPGPDGEIPVRVYRPEVDGVLPVTVYFHGGGFVIGSLQSHDATCRALCAKSDTVVVAVDYRLAPEHPFPAAPDDCYAATRWVTEHAAELGVDPARLAVAGDSAGGNLAAVVCLMAKERGGPAIALQVLVYPVTDHVETPSRLENSRGYLLTGEALEYFIGHYAAEADRRHPYCAPLRATDLSGLPPALIVTAEYDPLCDEGEAYGSRLRDAGVPVTVSRYDGMVHGFFQMTALVDRASDAEDEVAVALRKALA